MAVAQAQHPVAELTRGAWRRSAAWRCASGVHPVRRPAARPHETCCLAEARVPYDVVLEMDEINDDFAAKPPWCWSSGPTTPSTPAADRRPEQPHRRQCRCCGVWEAENVIVLQAVDGLRLRGGCQNPLFLPREQPGCCFGDAQAERRRPSCAAPQHVRPRREPPGGGSAPPRRPSADRRRHLDRKPQTAGGPRARPGAPRPVCGDGARRVTFRGAASPSPVPPAGTGGLAAHRVCGGAGPSAGSPSIRRQPADPFREPYTRGGLPAPQPTAALGAGQLQHPAHVGPSPARSDVAVDADLGVRAPPPQDAPDGRGSGRARRGRSSSSWQLRQVVGPRSREIARTARPTSGWVAEVLEQQRQSGSEAGAAR